jgi:hypothetical protein
MNNINGGFPPIKLSLINEKIDKNNHNNNKSRNYTPKLDIKKLLNNINNNNNIIDLNKSNKSDLDIIKKI